jgi:nucleotide-binding universal stress UspA family protein
MVDRPSVLCPVDFSDASKTALRYAVALAEHVYGVLTVATVDDPLLAAGADAAYGPGWLKPESIKRLKELLSDALDGRSPTVAQLNLDVAIGKPAREILRLANLRHADLIVISTHGHSGIRKWVLGSTTERVLRDTTVPVLVTPPQATAPDTLEAARLSIRRVFVPIDFTGGTVHQVQVASGIAEALGASVVLAHVAEPILAPPGHERFVVRLRREHRLHVQSTLHELLGGLPSAVRPTFVTGSGDPAHEIERLARLCDADLTVMGLHASAGGGPRMGSVTYRVLCRTHGLVLALPPRPHGEHKTSAHAVQHNEVAVVG